MRVLLPDNGTE